MKPVVLFAIAIAVSAAGGASAGSPPSEVDQQLTLSRGLFVALGDRPCRATCEGQPLPEGPNQECFGLLKVFCGPPPPTPGEPPKHELMGVACQGHWKSVAVDVPSGATGSTPSLVTVCEGEHRWISLQTSTCPHSNHTTKKMMGVLSLGEIISVMSVSGEQAALQLAPHVRRDEAATHQAQEVLQELGRRHLPTPGTKAAALKEGTSRTFAFQSKHHGFKVDWQATKRVPPSEGVAPAPAEEQTFESLEDQAKDAIAPSWRDWLPSGPPPPEHHGNGTFELLCNGKPAWLHGAVPCHGNFTVAGTQSWGAASSASSAGAAKRSSCKGRHQGAKGMMGRHHAHEHQRSSALRRLLATPVHLGDASSSMRPAVEVLPAQQQQHEQGSSRATVGAVGVGHRLSMKAECDGLWTGILGHTCFGVSTSHLEVAEEPPVGQALRDEDDVRALTKWSVCTGHQGIRFVHRDFTSGMAVSCKGGSVMSLSLTVPWRP